MIIIAVTILRGEGRECNKKTIAFMVIQRKAEKTVKKTVKSFDPKVVINSTASNGLLGGVMSGRR
ncbi:DUF2179 domain-containing protein [Treponema brennaborense]|uniref:DUF2179 domain-containing protein n=1 Tax=Treponema brennaborense TaxID=81028 RepID=UPI00059F7673|nr:DUF2179 domain-containing protein [Treponema brennaborense]